jgi:hypothetical protein
MSAIPVAEPARESGVNEVTIGGGSLMGDGQCSFIESISVGSC